jgi:uncharacterized protein
MKCPICDVDLVMSERQGIEIDYCSKCRGVWLDRGELDKIIERSAPAAPPSEPPPPRREEYSRPPQEDPRRDYPPQSQYEHVGHDPRKKRKRGSFLEDVFDFD